jgi:hypothetical protein
MARSVGLGVLSSFGCRSNSRWCSRLIVARSSSLVLSTGLARSLALVLSGDLTSLHCQWCSHVIWLAHGFWCSPDFWLVWLILLLLFCSWLFFYVSAYASTPHAFVTTRNADSDPGDIWNRESWPSTLCRSRGRRRRRDILFPSCVTLPRFPSYLAAVQHRVRLRWSSFVSYLLASPLSLRTLRGRLFGWHLRSGMASPGRAMRKKFASDRRVALVGGVGVSLSTRSHFVSVLTAGQCCRSDSLHRPSGSPEAGSNFISENIVSGENVLLRLAACASDLWVCASFLSGAEVTVLTGCPRLPNALSACAPDTSRSGSALWRAGYDAGHLVRAMPEECFPSFFDMAFAVRGSSPGRFVFNGPPLSRFRSSLM